VNFVFVSVMIPEDFVTHWLRKEGSDPGEAVTRIPEGDGYGNTQVTCHVGVPSCGQRHRNVFIAYLLMLLVTQSSNHRLASPRLHAPSSSRALFSISPPTHSCIITLHLIPTQPQPGRGGSVERGVHPPSPSTFAPWSSRRQVACFHAPRRLPVNPSVFYL
jgi:hypothetical protein